MSMDDSSFELPLRGDDRPGLDEVEDPEFLEEDDYPEDAAADEIDLVIALYREEGQPVGLALANELANDLDALIKQLRRIPGDAGALGMVSIDSSVFVLVRVRGKKVQLFLSDWLAADDWPIARDVVDFVNEELPGEDDESEPFGDSEILADVGLHDFDLEEIASEYDEDSVVLLKRIAKKIGFGPQYKKLANL
ncbi:MAG: tRNA adenosine deaminase-associated protein [Propionibacteriaceae bacterium]|jgi:putative tRNA adenosine deaminase-associated protein|nr:tRNA adenosine deaminase-associated protein [Propionibacteriaceae bacterium]